MAVPSPTGTCSDCAGGAVLIGAGGSATGGGGGGGGGGGAACGTGAGGGTTGAGAGGAGGGAAGRATAGRGGGGGGAAGACGASGLSGGRGGGFTGDIACVGIISAGFCAGAGGVMGAPQYPQKRHDAGKGFRQRGHGICPAGAGGGAAAGLGGGAAAPACIGLWHRAQFTAEAGLGVPHEGQRIYRIVPCSVESSGMTSSFLKIWNGLATRQPHESKRG